MNLQTSIDFEKEKVGVQYVQAAAWYLQLAHFRFFRSTTLYRSTVDLSANSRRVWRGKKTHPHQIQGPRCALAVIINVEWCFCLP